MILSLYVFKNNKSQNHGHGRTLTDNNVGGGGGAKKTLGIRKFNPRRNQVKKEKKIFPLNPYNQK